MSSEKGFLVINSGNTYFCYHKQYRIKTDTLKKLSTDFRNDPQMLMSDISWKIINLRLGDPGTQPIIINNLNTLCQDKQIKWIWVFDIKNQVFYPFKGSTKNGGGGVLKIGKASTKSIKKFNENKCNLKGLFK